MGVLTLAGSSVLNLGTGGFSSISFANSSAASWGANTLNVYNWQEGTSGLSFGTDATGLTGTQLSQIDLYSDAGSTLLGQAFITDGGAISIIPEPSSLALVVLAGGLAFLMRRRRI